MRAGNGAGKEKGLTTIIIVSPFSFPAPFPARNLILPLSNQEFEINYGLRERGNFPGAAVAASFMGLQAKAVKAGASRLKGGSGANSLDG